MRRHLKNLGISFAGTVLLFSAIVSLGTCCVLLICDCFGYLPYSDRPGPGWWGHLHWPAWAEIATYFGFAPLLAYGCLFFGFGLFVLSLALGLASPPRWMNCVLGALYAGAAALLAVAGAGWYFAIASIGPDSAGILGIAYGVFLFPRFVPLSTSRRAAWIRVSVAVCAGGLFAYWIVMPFLPRKQRALISYDLVLLTPGNQPVTPPVWLGEDVAQEIKTLNLHGVTHGGIGSTSGSYEGAPEIHVELIALEPITAKARLSIPKQGSVVYTLQGGIWTAHPSISKTDKRTLILQPGIDPKYDGGQVQIDGEKLFSFTWYPTISKNSTNEGTP
jgi:hypothetical protein